MVHALDRTRLTAPDIAGAAGDAGEAADAASFASLLDTLGFEAGASDAVALPQFNLSTLPTAEGGDNTDGADDTSDDDPSRVNDAAFLVLTVAFPQPSAPPVRGDAANSAEQAPPEQNGIGPTDAGFIPQADGLFGRLRHLRLVASDRAGAADAAPRDGTQVSSDAANRAEDRPLQRSMDDRVSDFMARVTRPSHGQPPQEQILEVRDAVPGDTPPAQDPSLDAADIMARRAVDAAWNTQVTQDRSAARAALDQAGPATIGEPGVPRVSAAVPTDNEAFAGFQDERNGRGNGDAGGNAPGSPFPEARRASPIAGLRPLHTLVPVAFDVARDGALSATTTAASAALPNEDGVSTSIVQALRLQVTAGGGSATITLDPSYLGGVRVAVQVADGAVTATLHAANPQVRAWMEANESTLRQSLLDHGLTLDRLIVAEDHGADLQRDPNPQYDTPGEQPQPRQRRHDGGERFEVIV